MATHIAGSKHQARLRGTTGGPVSPPFSVPFGTGGSPGAVQSQGEPAHMLQCDPSLLNRTAMRPGGCASDSPESLLEGQGLAPPALSGWARTLPPPPLPPPPHATTVAGQRPSLPPQPPPSWPGWRQTPHLPPPPHAATVAATAPVPRREQPTTAPGRSSRLTLVSVTAAVTKGRDRPDHQRTPSSKAAARKRKRERDREEYRRLKQAAAQAPGAAVTTGTVTALQPAAPEAARSQAEHTVRPSCGGTNANRRAREVHMESLARLNTIVWPM